MGQPQPNEVTIQAMTEARELSKNFATVDSQDDILNASLAEDMRIENLRQEAVKDGRKLVTVREINAIDDIPGADLIKVATVEGWKVVVKAGEFKEGDLCVFFEVDSYLPMSDERFKFLEKNATNWQGIPGARLKTIRLRKQLSQGLALPLSAFPEILEEIQVKGDAFSNRDAYHNPQIREDYREMNFTGTLGIFKWEKVMSAQLAGQAKGDFPSFLRKSDQERCQNMGPAIFGYEATLVEFDASAIPAEVLNTMRAEVRNVDNKWFKVRPPQASRDTRYEVSLKMDGSSMTVYVKEEEDNTFLEGVCSRNLDLKMEGNEENSFVQMAQSGLLEVIRKTRTNIAVQGELMGPGIQGNRENFKGNRFFIYNIFDIKAGVFLTPDERARLVNAMQTTAVLEELNVVIEHVPVLRINVTLDEIGIHNMDDLLKFAVGPSMVNLVREGVVFKAMDGSQQFKAISNLYLEQEK